MCSVNVRMNEQTRSPQFLVLCFFIFFFSSAPLNFKKQKLKNLKFLAESQSGKLSLSPEFVNSLLSFSMDVMQQ